MLGQETTSTGLGHAASRVTDTARRIREQALEVLDRDDAETDGKAVLVADTLARVSDSLEAVAESARASGLALSDRGRDASKALARGERVLRESGLPGAAVATAVMTRRHAKTLALAGAGLVALAVLVRQRRRETG